jgi:LacI family transcriptional regulator
LNVSPDSGVKRAESRVKRATIEDVAKLAGVSRQTVSRAVNDKAEIDAETKRRVLDAARSLNYRPSRFARGLIRQDTTTLGLIISDIGNPFFPELASGVLRAAQARDWQVVLYDTGEDPEREVLALSTLADQADVGAGFLTTPAVFAHAVRLGVPFAVLDPGWDAGHAPGVGIDIAAGVRLAVEHLAGAGHRRVGMIDGAADPRDKRRTSFLAIARELGLDVSEADIESAPRTVEGGADAVRALRARRPDLTAAFAYNDVLAVGAVRGLKAEGLRVPEDFAVVGFDGLPLGELVEPPITSVYVDIRRMGELAVAAAAELLAGRTPEPVVVRPELRVRGSA